MHRALLGGTVLGSTNNRTRKNYSTLICSTPPDPAFADLAIAGAAGFCPPTHMCAFDTGGLAEDAMEGQEKFNDEGRR